LLPYGLDDDNFLDILIDKDEFLSEDELKSILLPYGLDELAKPVNLDKLNAIFLDYDSVGYRTESESGLQPDYDSALQYNFKATRRRDAFKTKFYSYISRFNY